MHEGAPHIVGLRAKDVLDADPHGGLGPVASSKTDGSGATAVAEYEGGRARLDLGLSHQFSSGLDSWASGFYDGLCAQDYEA